MTLRSEMMKSRRLAGEVLRYHTWPTLRQQTVAEHSWQVMRIYVELFGTATPEIWEHILWHDVTEMWTGDIPFPVKRNSIVMRQACEAIETQAWEDMGLPLTLELSEDARKCIKLCDLLEMWEFGMEEMALGNKLAAPIVQDTGWAASQIADELECTQLVRKWMDQAKAWIP